MGVFGVKDGGASVKLEIRDLFDEIHESFQALEQEREGTLALRRDQLTPDQESWV